MSEKVLLTGISGWIAKHTAIELLYSGYEVLGTVRNESLIEQINIIMESSNNNSSNKIINSGFFKNNAQLLTTLQSQNDIASNRNKYLHSEKEIIKKKIIENNFKKIKAEEKATDYKRHYLNELENKNYQ